MDDSSVITQLGPLAPLVLIPWAEARVMPVFRELLRRARAHDRLEAELAIKLGIPAERVNELLRASGAGGDA